MTVDIDLTPLVPKGRDLEDAAMVAARAFYDDPFFEYLDPHAVTRARGLAIFWRSTIAAAGPKAIITGARQRRDGGDGGIGVDGGGGRLVGLSVVIPPGNWPLSIPSQLRQLGGAVRAMMVRPPALAKGARYLFSVEAAHPKDRLWYLLLLVVDPSVQRSGVGSRLQQEMLRQADAQGLDCYLETQKEENVPYYGRFGYQVTQELKPVSDGPPLFLMRRAPQS